MPELFEKNTLTGIELANRFVRSATNEGMADEAGRCTPQLIEYLLKLVEGRVGLIISGHAYVSKEGQAGNNQLGVYSDELLPSLKEMTGAIHDAGGRIIMQIAHAGCQAEEKTTGLEPLGPSTIENEKRLVCRGMTAGDISRVVEAFAKAASRAKEAGFDGVQIHGAHGYLLSEFLSGYYNKRTDGYGGNIENRARIVIEVLRSIKSCVGDDFPVHIKLNSEDFLEGGLSVGEMLTVAGKLQAEGIGAIELSGGTINSDMDFSPVRPQKQPSETWEAFYKDTARRLKAAVSVPLILVGGIRSYSVAESLIAEGTADYISLSRPLIREPDLVKRWADGDRSRARCVSDNACFMPLRRGKGIYCVTQEKLHAKEKKG